MPNHKEVLYWSLLYVQECYTTFCCACYKRTMASICLSTLSLQKKLYISLNLYVVLFFFFPFSQIMNSSMLYKRACWYFIWAEYLCMILQYWWWIFSYHITMMVIMKNDLQFLGLLIWKSKTYICCILNWRACRR